MAARWECRRDATSCYVEFKRAAQSAISLYLVWIARKESRSLGMAAVLMLALLGGFFVAAATMDRYGGVLIDPATVSLMPNQDRLFGLPANLAAFGIGLALVVIGYLIARGAKRES
jgi:hypothetical protein